MENIKIWHTPDEQPILDKEILFMYGTHFRCGFYSDYKNGIFTFGGYSNPIKLKNIKYWCYVDDLIATSKALDVAIGALKRLRDMPEEDNDQWFNYCCPRCVLAEISEIMKGGK